MKKLALVAANTLLSYLFVSLWVVVSIVSILATLESIHAADFFCPSGNVTCLIAAINDANGMPGGHTINLEPGIYTLQIVNNMTDGENGLPSIRGSIQIQAAADDPPTVIERDPAAQRFRIFHVSAGGELSLEGVTVQRGFSGLSAGPAIFNRGMTTLQDTIVTDNEGESGAIHNFGTVNFFRSVITDNDGGHDAGGIVNEAGGSVLLENSTIANNVAIGAGGILNQGAVVISNSAIIANSTDQVISGGGILNGGSLEIVNSTIAKNRAARSVFGGGGGGVLNSGGQVSITNSTIRENEASFGGGIANFSGILRIQNTIVAGNTVFSNGPDCWGVITTLGNNLVGDPSANCNINLQPSDLTGNPGLGALTGTGEDDLPGTAHYPVLAGSPLIDKGNPNACFQADQLGNLRAGVCDIGAVEFRGPMLVSVDVRPKKDANRINPNSDKDINVAIFSVNGFDATGVDTNTVRFGATGTEAAPVHIALRDVDGDGNRDMVLRFQIPHTGIKCGDTSASLTGQSFAGLTFIGSSPIKTVQCKK
jgi:acetyltransferase-like isoleucine patch superfamily enzyme